MKEFSQMEQQAINKDIFFNNLQKGGNMIAVCSGSYGVGKTWFSTALCAALSSQKKKVLLFDGDGGSCNVASFLGIVPQNNLETIVYKRQTLNQIIYKSDKLGFDIICGDKNSAGLSALPIGRLQILAEDLAAVSKPYDNVVLDIGSGDEKSAKILAGMAKHIILIIDANPKSLIGGYDFFQTMSEQYPASRFSIVVNQVNSLKEGQMIYNTFAAAAKKFLRQIPQLIGVVRSDTRVRDCQKNQTLILSRYPSADASIDVLKIAEKIETGEMKTDE